MYFSGDQYHAFLNQSTFPSLHSQQYQKGNIAFGEQVLSKKLQLQNHQSHRISQGTFPKDEETIINDVSGSKKYPTVEKSENEDICVEKIKERISKVQCNVCERICKKVQKNQQQLVVKIEQIKSKPKVENIKGNSSISSIKNRQFLQFFTQTQSLFKTWNNKNTEPTKSDLIQWVSDKNFQIKNSQQKIKQLKQKLKEKSNIPVQSKKGSRWQNNTKDSVKMNHSVEKKSRKELVSRNKSILKKETNSKIKNSKLASSNLSLQKKNEKKSVKIKVSHSKNPSKEKKPEKKSQKTMKESHKSSVSKREQTSKKQKSQKTQKTEKSKKISEKKKSFTKKSDKSKKSLLIEPTKSMIFPSNSCVSKIKEGKPKKKASQNSKVFSLFSHDKSRNSEIKSSILGGGDGEFSQTESMYLFD